MILIYGKLPVLLSGSRSGKILGSALAAKFVGQSGGRDSLTIGALMNTRGLMELIVLNIWFRA
jgi:Kef-type K+ transport system membrane component KefB